MKLLVSLATLLALASQAQTPQAPSTPAVPDPQQPPITFRAEVNYVEVDARVVDAQGKFRADLQPADFQVFEDGKRQEVKLFSIVNIPVERAERPLFASKPIDSDVRNNLQAADGRIYIIVLDDYHTDFRRTIRVRQAAREFVEKYIGANDMAAIVYTSGRSDSAQEFTTSQRLLLKSIDSFAGKKVRSATMNRIDEEARTRDLRAPGEPIRDLDDQERSYQARNTLDAIKNLSDYLGNIRGRRKAIVMFSEGIDYDINDVFNNPDATTIMDSTREMIAAATRANVAIYSVDPRGLTSGMEDNIEIQSFPADTTLGLGQSALYNEVRLGQDSLRVMADETGGFAAVNRNDFTSAFQRIVDDNSSYYVMGYYSTNDRRDGRYRKIEVRLNNKPGLTVRARKGYVAPRGRAPETKNTTVNPNASSPELREALESPLPLTGLPVAMTAVVFKGPAPKGSVVVSTLIPGSAIPLVEKEGTFRNDLEVQVVASDVEKGKVYPTDRNTVNLNVKPDTAARIRATGFRVIQSLDVPPGRYQLRVAVREANTMKAGSVTFDLLVPDFSKAPLSMSSLALTSQLSTAAPTVRPKDPLEKILPGPLSAYREFPQQDEIALFCEIYDNTGRQPHKVDISASVKAEGGQSFFDAKEEHDSSELAGSSGGYGFSTRIPLAKMAPGLYVLHVEATSRLGDRPTVSQEIIFRVR